MRFAMLTAVLALWAVAPGVHAQAPDQPPPPTSSINGPPPDGPGPRGMGPMGQERKLVKDYDKDGDGRLNLEERTEAREFLKTQPRRAPRGGGGRGQEPAQPGPKVTPGEVETFPKAELYDPGVLRTIFFEFESEDWEAELADFYNTDVEVPATMTVDGVKYPGVGVHFRGASSFFMVPAGHKRSLNVSVDFTDSGQRLRGYRTLNLLNLAGDPSFLSTVLYSALAREHIAAPRANHVRVVINGESWGVYTSVQQFDKTFLTENFGTDKGARWKVKGSPGGSSGLDFIGENIEDYKRRYEMKSGGAKDWADLLELCRTLSTTPIDELEEALRGRLDVEGALWFLALDAGLANSDGYWTRASDYNIYKDPAGVFHIIPHDVNEAFSTQVGPGGPGGQRRPPRPPGGDQGGPPGERREPPQGDRPPPDRRGEPREPGDRREGGEPRRPGAGPEGEGPRQPEGAPRRRPSGAELDPFVASEDPRKPLRSRLLKVPAFREKYVENLRTLAGQLRWENFGRLVEQRRVVIKEAVREDTRKLASFEAFERATSSAAPAAPAEGQRPAGGLRAFAEQRSRFLLNHPEVSGAKAGASRPPSAEGAR
ncbi:MAG: CotH kinase family protein [Phycisphaerales bacterium]